MRVHEVIRDRIYLPRCGPQVVGEADHENIAADVLINPPFTRLVLSDHDDAVSV